MTVRALAHVGVAAFGLFVAALNALGPSVAAVYLVAGVTAGPAVGRFVADRRKLQADYYGPPPARGPTWTQPTEQNGNSCFRFDGLKAAKIRRLASDPRTPAGERAAAEAALRRMAR